MLAACFSVALTACGGNSTGSASGTRAAPTTASQPSTPVPAPTTVATTTASTTTVPSTTVPSTTELVDTTIGVYGNCTNPSVEPAEIVLACADYGSVLKGLHWTSWIPTGATGVGTLDYNVCVPDCAGGHFHSIPDTTVTLSVPVPGAGGSLVWSEVQENPEPPSYETGPFHGGPQPLLKGPD